MAYIYNLSSFDLNNLLEITVQQAGYIPYQETRITREAVQVVDDFVVDIGGDSIKLLKKVQ